MGSAGCREEAPGNGRIAMVILATKTGTNAALYLARMHIHGRGQCTSLLSPCDSLAFIKSLLSLEVLKVIRTNYNEFVKKVMFKDKGFITS